MRGVPPEVMEQAIKVSACLQEMFAVQIKHGLSVDRDYDCAAEVQIADPGDVEFLHETPAGFSFFVGRRGEKQWYVQKRYDTGRRIVADVDFADFPDGEEPFANHPKVQWEWMNDDQSLPDAEG